MYQSPYHSGSLEGKSVLVTGGAGFIGSNIVEYLLKFGAFRVRVLDNLATGKASNLKPFIENPALEFIEGDIRDFETCEKVCKGVDYISHQAALGSVPRSVKQPWITNDVNVGGFVNMISAAKMAGVKRFVYASSSSVYGDEKSLPKMEEKIGNPLSPYAVSKLANELYASVFFRTYNMPVIGLRYFNIFGPNQDPEGEYAAVIPKFVHKVMSKTEVIIDGDGEQTRDFTFVENAVQANVKAMFESTDEALGKVYNIAVGQNFSVNQLYNAIQKNLGREHPARYGSTRQGDVRNSLADISLAQNLLQYKPAFDFNEGLQITVDYFRKLYSS